MKIRSAQLASFGAVARLDSEEHIFRLLEQHFRDTPAWISDEAARATVRAAVDKAAAHGMPSARDAFKVAVLMLVFGASFDRDEPWARRILAERAGKAPVGEMLYRAGIERVEQLEEEG
jgi:hypothetical protein